MLEVGRSVRVRAPFAESFPGVYLITEIVTSEDGTHAFILGELGGFDETYLEAEAA